jgi:succinoglycan biosynthesis transport protein ExoP
MNSYNDRDEVELMDYLTVIGKRRWLIIAGTLILVAAAAITSFLLPKIWEVDAIMVPSKFMVQTEQGDFKEVVVTEPKQIAGQINQESYNNLIAKELNLDPRTFPKIRAENLRDTKLVRVWVKNESAEEGAAILNSLFAYLKAELDRKIQVEIKGVDTKIATNANMIKQKNLDIESAGIDIAKTKQEILSDQTKLKISEERLDKIIEEMKSVKEKVGDIEKTQQNMLAEKQEGAEALALLLYSNEVQQNLRYYDALDEKFSAEKLTQENLRFSIKEKEQAIKQLNTSIDKLKNEINDVERENELLNERKLRIDYTQLVKEPTPSRYPVFPKKRVFVLVGTIVGLLFFTLLAFLLDYIEKKRKTDEKG